MKYIRTKDGKIIETHDNLQIIDNAICIMQNEKVWLVLGEVLKQADIVPELCDQLVYVEDTIPENIYPALMNPKGIIECQIALGCTKVYKIENFKYGIWTKKGLKYVAQFNDKGELELL